MKITPEEMRSMMKEVGCEVQSGGGWVEDYFGFHEGELAAYTAKVLDRGAAHCERISDEYGKQIEPVAASAASECAEGLKNMKPVSSVGGKV